MKLRVRYLYIVLIIIAFSCKGRSNKITFEKEFSIHAQKKQITQLISPGFISVKGNYFFITNLASSDSLIYCYETPNLIFSGGFGKKGKGPDEFVGFPMFCKSTNNYLYIRGYTPMSIKKITVDDLDSMTVINEFKLQKYENINQPSIFNDSIFIYNAFPNSLSIKKYDLKNNKLYGVIDFKIDRNEKDLFYASNRGILSSNGSVIVYAYMFKKQIDIYDMNSLKLKLSIKDNNKKIKPQVPMSFNDDKNIYHYQDIVTGENYFYALYQGTTNKKCTLSSSVIEVYNYEGNPIAKLKFDIAPNPFVVDEKNNCIYGYLTQLEGVLLKYDLPRL